MGIIVLACGGRDYNGAGLGHTLDAVHAEHGIDCVIEGGARGADTTANAWALRNGVHVAQVPALWTTNGKSAGPIRNAIMLRLNPDLVVAAKGGRGTQHMVDLARAAKVPVKLAFDPPTTGVYRQAVTEGHKPYDQ